MKEMEKFFCGWTSEIVLEQENSYEQDTFTLGIKVYFAVDEDDKKYTFKDDVGDSFEVFIIFVDEIETQKDEIETQEVQKIIDELKSLYPKLKIEVD